jgi:hypothetical protein
MAPDAPDSFWPQAVAVLLAATAAIVGAAARRTRGGRGRQPHPANDNDAGLHMERCARLRLV